MKGPNFYALGGAGLSTGPTVYMVYTVRGNITLKVSFFLFGHALRWQKFVATTRRRRLM